MKFRLYIFFVPFMAAGCPDLPFLSHGSTSNPSTDASADGTNPTVAGDDGTGGPSGSDLFPGFGATDAGTDPATNSVDDVAIAAADDGSFAITPPWSADAGVDPLTLGVVFPDPSSLPSASATSASLALSSDSRNLEVGSAGCGEPPTCYLRTFIVTRLGHVYSAALSKSHPKDSCVTKVIACDHDVLVGDSNGRFGDPMCGTSSPQTTLGFLLPETLLFSWNSGQVWQSTSGFKSEWTLAQAGNDSGSYEPIPGQTSKLWPLWSRYYANGEVYGEMFVPLRNSKTHELAIGFALFDIRVRQ